LSDLNGAIPPAPIHQGALSMGYYNMCAGDAADFKFIADNYAISDNYHQSVIGGTGANHIMLGTGDMAYYDNAQGHPLVPPSNQIENPNPKPGTNNNYTQDGYVVALVGPMPPRCTCSFIEKQSYLLARQRRAQASSAAASYARRPRP
jgi:hypothetical protein